MAKYIKNIEKPVQKYRFVFQSLFALLCIWIGVEFYLFTTYLQSGGTTTFYDRPAGVEGFLPISALMSLYYFLLTGEIHDAHPAGFFILLAIISISFVFGKSFCSWFCPVGFISELVGDFGEKIQKKLFKRKLKLPKILDFPLRSLKYLLLAFFVYAIFISMTTLSLKYFLNSPYNIVADVKMFHFFANISQFALIVIGVLFLLSIIIRNFWCRYLCPYGALLGLASLLSPNKINRNTVSCIDCGLCAKACPSNIKVDKKINVFSDECSTCLSCVDACPVADTLDVKSLITKKKISKLKVAIGIAVIYLIIISIGMLTGNWESKATKEEYLLYYQNLEKIGHPTSVQEIETLNKVSKKGKADGRIQNK